MNGLGYEPDGVTADVAGGRARLEVEVKEASPDRKIPDMVAFGHIGSVPNWTFDLTDSDI